MAEWHPALVSWDLLRHLVGSTLEKVINHKKKYFWANIIFLTVKKGGIDNFVQECF